MEEIALSMREAPIATGPPRRTVTRTRRFVSVPVTPNVAPMSPTWADEPRPSV